MTRMNRDDLAITEHECSYCGHYISNPDRVPSAGDDAAWAEIAKEHAHDCPWVTTRAHRVEDGQ